MNFDPSHFIGSLIPIALVLFFFYRRLRRNFGRQKLGRKRLKFRMYLLGTLGALGLLGVAFSPLSALATVAGIGMGVALALWAAKHTRFEKQDDTLYYIPHTYAGMVVSALFLGRIIYRFVILSSSMGSLAFMDSAGASPGDFGGFSAIAHNPVTRCIFYIVVGYYVYYYWYVLHESEHLKPEDWEKKEEPPKVGGNVK